MKIAFVVHNEHYAERFLKLLQETGVDYFTRWDKVIGKGRDTDPHMGMAGSYPDTNSVVMIAFEDEAALARLIEGIQSFNAGIKRRADHVRLFQLPLERVV